jgi:hypothetical protein
MRYCVKDLLYSSYSVRVRVRVLGAPIITTHHITTHQAVGERAGWDGMMCRKPKREHGHTMYLGMT